MKPIQLQEANLINAYKAVDPSNKKLLELLFPELKKSANVMDRIKTFEDACAETGDNPDAITNNYPSDALDFKKACIICRALNEDWVPDWENNNQFKWSPYFDMRSGFGFSDSHYAITNSYTYVGSRLCFKSEELAKMLGSNLKRFTRVI